MRLKFHSQAYNSSQSFALECRLYNQEVAAMEWQNINQQHISTSFVYTLKIHDLEASRQAEYPEAAIPELQVIPRLSVVGHNNSVGVGSNSRPMATSHQSRQDHNTAVIGCRGRSPSRQ